MTTPTTRSSRTARTLALALALAAPSAGDAAAGAPAVSAPAVASDPDDVGAAEAAAAGDTVADPPAATDEELAAAAEVVVLEESWMGTDLVDARATTRAVTARAAEPRPDTAVLGDLLVGAPGVAVQRTGPGQGAPIVRGMIGSAVLVLVDGMRVNDAMFRPAPNQYTALVDPWAIERVEVVRGPGSTLFGSDALGGTINLVTPLPLFDGAAWRTRGHGVVAVTSADRGVTARAAAAAGRRDAGLALGVTWQRHGDRRAGGGERLAPSAYDSLALDATGHLERGRHATTAWIQRVDQPDLPRTDELRPGFGMDEPAADEWRYRPSRRTFVHLRHLVRRPFAGVRGAELHLAWQRLDDGRRIRDRGDATTTLEANRDDSLGVTARASAAVAGGELIAGGELWLDRVHATRAADDGTAMRARFASGARMQQGALFAQLRRRAGRLTVEAGARASAVALAVPPADRGQGAAVSALDWAGQLGAAVDLGAGAAVVANLGRAFRAPNVHDLSALGPRPGDRWQIPADDLAAEHGHGVDVGVRIDRPAITAEAFAFALRWDDRIDVVATGAMTDTGRAVVQSANVGRTRLHGGEAELALRPTRELELAADVMYVRGVQGAGADREPADRVPPLGGGVSARWSVAGVELGAGARWAAAQRQLSARDRDDPRIDPDGTPGFVTLRASARTVLAGFALTLAVENLLDRHYREHGSGTPAPGLDVGVSLARAL
jgi:outer membrane receptor protein involved in Fe transport